jgi:mono/diheme cytochrome c family protein
MNGFLVAAVVMLAAAGATSAARAQQIPPRSAKEGVFTMAQAERGKALYQEQCGSCHGTMESSTPDMAPLLNDGGFQNLWKDRSLARLFSRIQETMPQDKPGSLSPDQTIDIMAYVLSANALPSGEAPLAADIEALKDIRLGTGEP